MGYGNAQMKDLEATINRIDCDSVVIGTPINLARFIKINKPFVRVKYDLSSASSGALIKLLKSKKIIK